MNNDFQTVTILGLGYIGLPTAAVLATKGFQVQGCDINHSVVQTINSGNAHIAEKDLDVLISKAVSNGNLKAYTEPLPADVFIVCVPTPFGKDKRPDLTYVEQATKSLAQHLKPGNLVILESTSPVCTTEKIAAWLAEERRDLQIPTSAECLSGNSSEEQVYVAHCPERVLPGHIIRELIENDRIIGGIDHPSTVKAETFYQQFVTGGCLIANARTAELAKLCENAYRDVNIAFANELEHIADELKIDVWELIRLANRHPRVNILKPGPGVGGHCIAVDPWFIIDSAPKQANLIRLAREINDNKPAHIINNVMKKAEKLKNPVIACLGLSYKANIDDLRESPAIEIVIELANKNIGQILVVEPYVETLPQHLMAFDSINKVDLDAALQECDILLLLVDHNEFLAIDRQTLNEKIVIDTRGVWK